MSSDPQRITIDSAIAELFDRVRALERRNIGVGPWIYAGTYPTDPDTTPDSPPFQNGWGNTGGGLERLRFRWRFGGEPPDIEGSVTGGTVLVAVITLPDDPRFRPPAEIRYASLNDADGLAAVSLLPNGDLIRRT